MEGCQACGKKFTNCIAIPQRYLIGIMTSLATYVSYTMRVALSLAITEMVPSKNLTEEAANATAYDCRLSANKVYHTAANKDLQYDWDETVQGAILSSFYWSYIITHLPGALAAERIGGKHILAIGIMSNAFLTLLFPVIVVGSGGNATIVVVVRVIMGLGQGVVYPVVTAILAQWVPTKEKGFISSLTYSGALLGSVTATLLGGVLISAAENWDIVFYFFGGLTLVWNVVWQLLCYSFPRTNPCLKEKEREFLEEQLAKEVNKKKMKTPFGKILTSMPVWALVACQFGHDWGWFVMVTDLPKYFKSVLRLDIKENGFYTSFPFFLQWISSLTSGYIGDFLVKKQYLSIKATRLIFATLSQTGPAVFMVAASYSGCNKVVVLVMFTLCMFCMGFYFVGVKVNALDLAPNFAGTLMAIANGIGVFAGMLAPQLVGVMTPDQTLEQWRWVFWLAFGWLVGTNLIFIFFMSAEVQEWNYVDEQAEEQGEGGN